MTISLLLNIILAFSTAAILRYFSVIDTFLDYLVAFSVVFFCQIVFIGELLGILGLLYLQNIILFSLFILLFFLCLNRCIPPKSGIRLKVLFNQFITGLQFSKLEYFCLAVLIGFGLVKLSINLINPPFGWDNLNYHFTFPVEWIKQGSLNTPIVVNDDPAPTYYPINASLFFMWLIFPLKNVFLADFGSLPFFILSGILVYKIAWFFLKEKKLAFYCAVAFLLVPNIFKQIEIAYIDIIVCTLFLAALYSIIKFKESSKFQYLILSAASLGLLIGTKTLALVYALTLFIPLILLILSKFRLKAVYYCLVICSVILIFGGFSYIRNLFSTGNPLYPIDVTLFGKTIFKGVIDKASYSAHFIPDDYKIAKLLYHEGLGAQGTIFVVPGMLFLPIILLFKKKRDLFTVYLSFLPLFLFLIWRYLIPLANVRYLSPAIALGLIYGLFIFKMFIPRVLISFLVFVSVVASITEFSSHGELIISLAITAFLFIYLLKFRFNVKYSLLLAVLFILIGLPALNSYYQRNEFKNYLNTPFWRDAVLSWTWLNDNTNGSNVSYAGRPVPFPLYGSGFKNNVYYTSVNSIDPAKLHYYRNSRYTWGYDYLNCHKDYEKENNYRGRANFDVWLRNLRKRSTDFLYLYSLHQIDGVEFSVEDSWARNNPGIFELVFSNKTVRVYKLK